MKKDLSIYIHWPWCKKKCPYCDFNSHVNPSAPEDEYVDALITDLDHQKTLVGDRHVVSIFFGGGTPSLMPAKAVERVLTHIDTIFGIHSDTEITIECNPTSTNQLKLNDFKQAGINRCSIGVQSFHDKHLQFLGRQHSSSEAFSTIESARHTFDNVSFDLIYGLPDQKIEDWQSDLQKAIDFRTQHLSAYQLTIEPNTAFYSEVKKQKWSPLDDDTQADFFELTREMLVAHNFNHYEISNFALDGHSCKHNLNIWEYNDYIGVGAGAHGRYKNHLNTVTSTQNYKIPNKYIDSVKHVKHGIFTKLELDNQTAKHEELLMSLRIQSGARLELFDSKFVDRQALDLLIQQEMLFKNYGKIALSNKGQLLLDSILTKLFV